MLALTTHWRVGSPEDGIQFSKKAKSSETDRTGGVSCIFLKMVKCNTMEKHILDYFGQKWTAIDNRTKYLNFEIHLTSDHMIRELALATS